MRRREILTRGISGAALAWLGRACGTGSGGNPSPPPGPIGPQPVYELTNGFSLYDDFDGNGNLQTFDGRSLAAAGLLSSKIWGGTFGTEILGDPFSSRLFTIVDESGQRIEYGLQERSVGEVIAYLRRNPRPISSLEMAGLESLLNEHGKAAAADFAAEKPEIKLEIVQYLLNRKEEVLNDRGMRFARTLSLLLSTKSAEAGVGELMKQSFDERETALLIRFMAEKSLYDRIRNAPVRAAMREGANLVRAVSGAGDELQEIQYVFDADGRLIGAVPHEAGRPYHGSRKLRVLGATDAFLKTPAGLIQIEKGKAYGRAETVPADARGYILKVTNALQSFIKILLTNPPEIDFPDYRSFSADVQLSSESTGKSSAAGLDYHTTIPEQEPGRSWWAQNVIMRSANGETFLLGHYTNINMGIFNSRRLGPADLDTWYNLRMDVLTHRDAAGLANDEIRLDFYVDGEFKVSLFPEDSPILLDPERTGLGPHRSLVVYSEEGSVNAVGYFDNVRAVYKDRIE